MSQQKIKERWQENLIFFWFNNISVKSLSSVLLVEETSVPGENHQPVTSH
jgi:hypothetical protein